MGLSAGTWLACSGDDNGSTGGDAGSGSSSGTSSGTTSGSTSGSTSGTTSGTTSGSTSGTSSGSTSGTTSGSTSGSTTGSGDGGVGEGGGDGGAPTCAAYCAAIMMNCTGANAQYQTMTACMNACAELPVGASSDTSGDTIGCRTYHAGLAATGPNPHCWHAGPWGGDTCGPPCEAFCKIATTYCTAAGGFEAGAPPYTSLSDCETSCAGYARIDDVDGGGVFPDGGYNAMGPGAGNTLDCREYHLGYALTGGANQNTHCPHPAKSSATCM